MFKGRIGENKTESDRLEGLVLGNAIDSVNVTQLKIGGTAVGSTATEIDTRVLNYTIADVSTAETILVYVPYTGVVTGVYSVLEGAISAADATVTLKTSADAAMASLTIANASSAAGDIDSDTSISNSSVTAGTYLKLATDGGSTGAQRLWVTVVMKIT